MNIGDPYDCPHGKNFYCGQCAAEEIDITLPYHEDMAIAAGRIVNDRSLRHALYDNAHHFTCAEIELLVDLWRAVRMDDVAEMIVEAHANGDPEGCTEHRQTTRY